MYMSCRRYSVTNPSKPPANICIPTTATSPQRRSRPTLSWRTVPLLFPLVTEANPGRNAGRRADLVADQRSNSQKTTMPDETRVSSNIFAGCPKDLNWPGNTGVVLGAESGFPPHPSGYSSFGCAAIVSVWRSNGVEHHCDDIAWRGRRGADRVQGRI